MKANIAQLTRALDNPTPNVRFFLLYGPDEAGSAALAKRLERSLGPDVERIDIESNNLKADPARLADEAAALSLFGGRRFIRIFPADEGVLAAVTALLEVAQSESPVVAIAGALRASSALLKLALASPNALVFQSYAPDGEKAEALVSALGREVGLRVSSQVARNIAHATRNDRSLMVQELEKMALFLDAAPDRPTELTIEAVEQVGAQAAEGTMSRLVDAVMGGRPDVASRALAELAFEGVVGIPVLRALQRRIALLLELRVEMAGKGQDGSTVVDGRGNGIFFRERPGIKRDLAAWSLDQLATVHGQIIQAERAIKSSASAGDVMADATIIRTARGAARLR